MLVTLRVWHDNSGNSPGWQFAYMCVVDMMTKEKYFFICNGWLSISEGDGTVSKHDRPYLRLLPPNI